MHFHQKMITVQRKQGYVLKGALVEGTLSLCLTNDTDCLRFSFQATNQTLPEPLIDKFHSVDNIWEKLCQSLDYNVLPTTGIILLRDTLDNETAKIRMKSDEYKKDLFSIRQRLEKMKKSNHEELDAKEQQEGPTKMEERLMQKLFEMLQKSKKENEDRIGAMEKANLEINIRNQKLEKQVVDLGMKCEILENKFNQVLAELLKPPDSNQRLSAENWQEFKEPEMMVNMSNNVDFYLDKDCAGYPQVKIDDNRIIFLGNEECQLFTKVSVKKEKSLKFKITRSFNNNISLGVIDPQYRDALNSCYIKKHKHFVWYTGQAGSGLVESGRSYKAPGKGFGEGDEVIVEVDRTEGKIKWYRNGQISFQHSMVALKNEDIDWVFFIVFRYKFDMIEIMG